MQTGSKRLTMKATGPFQRTCFPVCLRPGNSQGVEQFRGQALFRFSLMHTRFAQGPTTQTTTRSPTQSPHAESQFKRGDVQSRALGQFWTSDC